MATANPFQQFISGLFGNLSGTSAAKPSTTGSSTYAGPYAPGYAAPKPAPTNTSGSKAYPGANATYTNPSDAANSYAQAAGVPYKPADSKTGLGGMSIAPTMTSAITGKPSASGAGVINPKADPGYVPYSSPSKPSTGSTERSASFSPGVVTASSAAPAAPAQAPAASGSYTGTGTGYTGGGSTPAATPDYMTKYIDTLSGLYDPNKLEDSQTALDKIRKRAADAQLGERKEERRIRENEVGQGLRSYNGQLTENSRKSSAELADLAIAASPFEQYIETARSAAKDIYGVGRDQQSDARSAASDALAERKFQEDVRQFGLRYALDQQQENRLSSTASKPSAQETIAAYVQAFTPGTEEYRVAQQNLGGVPPVDENGFITPEGFKAAAQEAAASGITRKQFLELFGSQLYADSKGNVDPKYGLTAVEKKLIQGTVE